MKKTLICLFIVFAGFINLYSQKTDKTTKETTITLSVKKTETVKTKDVQIVTDPADAIVEIDGVRVGLSPIMLQLEKGVHRIVVSKDKYQTLKKKIDISQHGIIKLDLKKETHANVTIKSDEGAMIYLNGELLGVTSVKRRLKYDLYELIIELNGEKVLRRMRIDEFSPAVLEAPIAGKLCIASKQQDVSVKINGAESQCLAAVGETPVTVSKEGYKTVNKTIHVDPFESKLVNINLKKLSRVRLWVEYNYSESANLSGTVGIAGKVGVYGRYKGNTGRRVDNVIHDVYNKESDMSEFQKKKAFRESITGGLMLRPINWFFIYGGMGQGKYYKIYEDLNGDYYSTRHINKGMEWEVGAVVRLGSIAVSYGYSQMKKNKDKIGEVNFGVGFMF